MINFYLFYKLLILYYNANDKFYGIQINYEEKVSLLITGEIYNYKYITNLIKILHIITMDEAK